MAIYHLNVRYCSKSKGQSAQAKNDYINRNDKYSKRLDDLQFSGFGNMPKFAENDPQKFWQASDIYERANARVCTEIVFALPRELNAQQQQELVSTFINSTVNTDRNKLPYSFAIHNDKYGNNPHCHLIFSERQLDGIDRTEQQFFKRANSKNAELGGAKKTADFRDREFILAVRKTWREQANNALEKHGHTARIDERSYQEQGIATPPRARLDRVTWQELHRLERENHEIGQQIARTGQEITHIAENAPKSTVEPFLQKAILKQEQIEKTPENRKQGLSQAEFDQFLIDKWLSPATELAKDEEQLAKITQDFTDSVAKLDEIQAEYDQLNEKNQGFLGLWESKEQKQRKQELADEFEQVAKQRNTQREQGKELETKIKRFKAEKIEPLNQQIAQFQADNPDLKMRKPNQLRSMQFQGVAEWHRQSQQRKIEWQKMAQEREQRRQQERSEGLSL